MRLKYFISGILVLGTLTAFTGCTPKKVEKPEYAENLTVSVTGGKITGTQNDDNTVAIFKGIPYAAAPVGDLRWKAPHEVTEWEGDLDCTLWGANALQGDATVFSYWTEEFIQDTNPAHYREGIVYSEDCLTLNIWSSYSVTEDKPVLVYIHGGGYNTGGASCEVYDGENIALKDVVFVSIQYRVGALGYMATQALINEEENSGAGNYGLLDQIAALKWVKENIQTFGGNPDNVTVMGQSAGSGSVNALIASPLASGLFVNAVTASHNSIYRNWQTVETRCSQLNLSYNGKKLSEMTVEELRAIPSEWLKGKTLTTGGPCIDNYVLPRLFKDSVLNKSANAVNIMSGNVAKDDLISSVYSNSAKNISVQDSMLALQNAIGDARTKGGYSEKTFIYMFEHNVPAATTVKEATTGARHSYELAYFFGDFSAQSGRKWTQTDYDLSQSMMTYLVNFCYNGDPNGGTADTWVENRGDYNYMNFSDTAKCQLMSEEKTSIVYDYYKLNF